MFNFLSRALKKLEGRCLYYSRYIRWLGGRRAFAFMRANRVCGRRFSITIPEIATPLNMRGGTSDVAVLEDTFLRGHYDFFLKFEPEIIVDAGAHIGMVSILFANRYPNSKIISIEPDHENFELLCANTAPYDNITTMHAALWHEDTMLENLNPDDENWAYQFSPSITGEFKAVSMEGIINDFNLSKVDLLKIDIEGAEKEVMSAAQGWIDVVGTVVIELHDRFRAGCSETFYEAVQGFPFESRSGPNIVVSMEELKESG